MKCLLERGAMKAHQLCLVTVVSLLATACGSSDHGGAQSADVRSRHLAQEGQSCGGPAVPPAQPVECAAGLVCKTLDVTYPGTCERDLAGEGESCGGAAIPPAVPRECAS